MEHLPLARPVPGVEPHRGTLAGYGDGTGGILGPDWGYLALIHPLNTVWQGIPGDRLERLIHSMPQRQQAVIDAEGGPTAY